MKGKKFGIHRIAASMEYRRYKGGKEADKPKTLVSAIMSLFASTTLRGRNPKKVRKYPKLKLADNVLRCSRCSVQGGTLTRLSPKGAPVSVYKHMGC